MQVNQVLGHNLAQVYNLKLSKITCSVQAVQGHAANLSLGTGLTEPVPTKDYYKHVAIPLYIYT